MPQPHELNPVPVLRVTEIKLTMPPVPDGQPQPINLTAKRERIYFKAGSTEIGVIVADVTASAGTVELSTITLDPEVAADGTVEVPNNLLAAMFPHLRAFVHAIANNAAAQ